MKKNNTLLYLALLAGAAFILISWKNKPKLKSRVIVEPLLKSTDSPDYDFPGTTTKDILIQDLKEAIDDTPEPLTTIINKTKGLFKKKVKTAEQVQKMNTRKLKKSNKKLTRKSKKRVKGFEDMPVLY